MRQRISYALRGTRAGKLRDQARKYPVVGQVKDVDGVLWDVRDVRTTKHGFDLHFGDPARKGSPCHTGLPRLIATPVLRDFWEANRTNGDGILFDLPAGRTTLKRVRHRLGINFVDDRTEFWMDRIEDLASMRPREFAAKHGVDVVVAFDWRNRMIGPVARAIGWWRKPKVRKILLSKLTLSQVGRKLDISITHAKRLRDRAKQEYGPDETSV